MSDTSEPQVNQEESLTDSTAHERATAIVEEEGLPEDNPFAEVVRDLHDAGKSWREIYATLEEVGDIVDQAAYEEGFEVMPDWRVAVLEHDRDTPSGQRYEYYERTARTAEEAEEMVERHTGLPVESKQTEQVGTSKVST